MGTGLNVNLGHCGEILIGVPTILCVGPYRMYYHSHEPNEPAHVHVDRDDQSAKFWLIPVGLARKLGFSAVGIQRGGAWASPPAGGGESRLPFGQME